MASSINGTSKESLADTVENVYQTVVKAGQLEIEVIATAMIYLKENPEASIEDALNVGLNDWDV